MLRANIDTVSAFLQTSFDETDVPTYTKLEPLIAELCDLPVERYYLMNRYFYGLPEASRKYYIKYSEILQNGGYTKSTIDSCLFYKKSSSETTYLILHVDDTYIFSTNQAGIDSAKATVRHEYPIEDRSPSEFLGIEITSINDTNDLLFRQPKILKDLFQEFPKRTHRHQINTPQTHHSLSSTTPSTGQQHTVTSTSYLHLLGILLHLTRTRLDISLAVSMCSTHSQFPSSDDYDQLLQIVDYLHETPNRGLRIKKHDSSSLQLYCHVDASYLLHPDARSHSGYCLSFSPHGPAFYCKSKKQALVSTSAMHAETRALYQLTQEILHIHLLAIELQLSLCIPTIVFEDNEPLIHTTTNPVARTMRCKHFLMLINFIKEQVQNNIIQLNKIPSELNPADALAKPTYGKDFHFKINHLITGSINNTNN